ncbi:hypothetical protein C1645_838547 [Glomus cerebriforme]|uniref:HMG box domain-containing protein n=1 Tax=Glomus cerebriforme TaxID=658196 RepID=A0A397SDR2_9GLOM|nr:hypothetical protein C1645_838547 [Glomus cerebriforme]
MSKTSLKQKSRKFINSNIDTISESSSNNALANNIKPSFPSTLTINDLIKNTNKNNKQNSIPNPFIVYRMALIKEYRIKNRKLPPMSEVSKIAKDFWKFEPMHVKDFYKSLVKDAKSIFKQNNIQIIYDKNMNYTNYVENSQEGYDAERQLEVANENLNSIVSVEDPSRINDVSHPSMINSSNHDHSDGMNSTLSAREEYIKVLEETIDHLIRN